MRTIIKLLLLSLILVSCDQSLRKETKITPVVECRIVGVDDLYFEDTIRFSDISYPRRICIYATLTNKSTSKAYVPLKDHFSDIPLSDFVLRLNGRQIYSYTKLSLKLEKSNFVLNPNDTVPVQIVIDEDAIKKGGMSRFARPQKILSNIKFSYKKNYTDTIHSKLPITDINFVFDETIRYQYRDTAYYKDPCTLFIF